MKEAEMIQDDPEVDLLGVLVNNNSEGEGAYNITLDQLMKEINGEDLEGLGDLEWIVWIANSVSPFIVKSQIETNDPC